MDDEVPDAEPTAEERFRAAMRRPPRAPFHVVLGIVLLGVCWVASEPIADVDTWAVLALAGVALGFTWILRLALFVNRPRPRGRARMLLVAPAMVAALALALQVQAPFRARFALSRHALDDFVRSQPDTVDPSAPAHRVGLFTIERTSSVGRARILQTGTGGFLTEGGFAYLPDGPGADLDGYHLTQIEGAWWKYTYSD